MSKRTALYLLSAATVTAAPLALGATTYPQPLPSGFSPTSGPPGTVITMTGSGFTGLTAVWIGNAHDAGLVVVNDGLIKITVPADATTQNIGLLNPVNSDFTSTPFTVTQGTASPAPQPAPQPTPSGPTTTPVLTAANISGAVSGMHGGAELNLSGPTVHWTHTNSTGIYSFTGVAAGTHTVAPTTAGYVFMPASVAVTAGGAAIPAVNFTGTATSAPTYRLSGTVSGAVGANVVVTLNGAAVGSASTDLGGNYGFHNLPAGKYTVSASLPGYAFTTERTVVIGSTDALANDFSATDAPAGSIALTPVTLPAATVGQAYSAAVVSGGSGTYQYQSGSYATGTPPVGMMINSNGTLTGTPQTAGRYTFSLCATDTSGALAPTCAPVSLVVSPTGPTSPTPTPTPTPVSTPTPAPTPTPTPVTPVASGTSWVYYNGTFDWPGDYSFSASPDYADTSGGPLSGPYDIKVSLTGQWGGWLPYALNWNFNSAPYTKLTFALKPTVDNQSWNVYFVKVGDVPVGIYLDVSQYGPAPVAGQWATYTVPLADLGVLGTDIYKFCIHDETGLASNTWYVDNVGFVP